MIQSDPVVVIAAGDQNSIGQLNHINGVDRLGRTAYRPPGENLAKSIHRPQLHPTIIAAAS
jgi:hypothetical protein